MFQPLSEKQKQYLEFSNLKALGENVIWESAFSNTGLKFWNTADDEKGGYVFHSQLLFATAVKKFQSHLFQEKKALQDCNLQ